MEPSNTQAAYGAGGTRMQQVTIYIGEQDHWRHRPLYLAILEQVRAAGGAGATVLKGTAGYSAGSRAIHTSNLVDVAASLPLVILIVDTEQQINALLPALSEMVAPNGGLITVADVTAYRYRHGGQGEALKVRQIMETQVVTVPPDLPVVELLPLLLHKFYKALPVVDAQGHVLGMVTDGDLLEKSGLGLRISVLEAIREQGAPGFAAVLEALQAGGQTARDVMGARPAAVIGPDASVRAAAQRMVEQGVKRLPVVDREGRLLGIVGRLDLLKAASHVLPHSGPMPPAPLPQHAQTLGEVMLPDALTVAVDTPLTAVIDQLVGSGGRRAIVTDAEGRVVGIITDADLVKRATPRARMGLLRALQEGLVSLGHGHDAASLESSTARAVMTTPVITAPATLSIQEGIHRMVEHGVKVLPITDEQNRLRGVVNRARLLEALIQTP